MTPWTGKLHKKINKVKFKAPFTYRGLAKCTRGLIGWGSSPLAPLSSYELANSTRGVNKLEVQGTKGANKVEVQAPAPSRELATCTRGVNKIEGQGSIHKPFTSKLHLWVNKLRFKALFSNRQLLNCTRGVNKVEVQGSIVKSLSSHQPLSRVFLPTHSPLSAHR